MGFTQLPTKMSTRKSFWGLTCHLWANRLKKMKDTLHLTTLYAPMARYRDSFTFFVCVSYLLCVLCPCVALCVVFCLSVVWYVYVRVLCLIVVPLPTGKIPFAVQLNNSNVAYILFNCQLFFIYLYVRILPRALENKMLKRKWQDDGGSCGARNFIICTLHRIFF
jgi:hypothetical protein